jgi:hypothetical protein
MDVTPKTSPQPNAALGTVSGQRKTSAPEPRIESHADPKPTPNPVPVKRRWLPALGALIVLAAVAGFGVHEFSGGGGPHIGITTTTGAGEPFGGAAFMTSDDSVTDKQWQERAAAFDKFKSAGPVQLDRAPKNDASGFIGKAVADPQARTTLAANVDKGATDMVAIGFFDDCAEDGDIVTVTSGAVKVVVPLMHKVQYVLIPVPKGQSANVEIGGVQDGSAGITLGMVTPVGIVHMPRILPGQNISFQAR